MRTIKCKFCDKRFNDVDHYVAHLEQKHTDMIPSDMVPHQYFYFLKTGKKHGICVMCKHPTAWNPKTKKYARF